MDDLKFSVLMSVYFKENPEYFELAMESVCNQTIKPTEVVLVVEGQLSKELEEKLKNLKSKYKFINTYDIESGNGLGSSLKFGLTKCKYNYVMRADTDDICVKNRFEAELEYMKEHPEIDVLGSSIYEFKESIDEENIRLKNMPTGENIYKYAKKRNPLNHMTVCMKKDSVLEVGNYSTQRMLEDYELWLRMIVNGKKIENINTPLVYARIGNGFEKRRGNKTQIKLWIKIQKYMYKNNMISIIRYWINILNMYIMVYTPNSARVFAYKYILRK